MNIEIRSKSIGHLLSILAHVTRIGRSSRVRIYSRDFDRTVSGNRVPGTQGIKKVLGQDFRFLLYIWKMYFCILKVCFAC